MTKLDIAQICHDANASYCKTIGDGSQLSWKDAPLWQKESAIKGVEFHLANPNSQPCDSHNSWLEQKRQEGWIYAPIKNPEKKEHPCFVPYEALSIEQQIKDYLFLGIVRELEVFVKSQVTTC